MKASIKQIAELTHNLNFLYSEMLGENPTSGWWDLPASRREEACQAVRIHILNPFMTPEQAHESWRQAQYKLGWVWGQQKNNEDKTHPCLVPWRELPAAQRVKDSLFHNTVRAFLEHGEADLWPQ